MSISLDGFIEGPDGNMDWMIVDDEEEWQDMFKLLTSVDTFLLGRVMYPVYANHWRSVLTNPAAPKNERTYAQIAERTAHIVFSETMEKPLWDNTVIMKGDIAENITKLKQEHGKSIVVWGGARLASTCINLGLVDEYRFVIMPVLLAAGKSLFGQVTNKQPLQLLEAKTFPSGATSHYYATKR
jgi:dihydrofolate reductase